jgi:ribosome-associated protein
MTGEQLAKRAVEVVHDKLGEDILLLDLRDSSPLTDYFVVVTASSTIHAQAIAEELLFRLKHEGRPAHHAEGIENGQWILLDYFDVVVHIFLGETRQFYGLERLWGDAPRQTLTPIGDRHTRPGAHRRRLTGGTD